MGNGVPEVPPSQGEGVAPVPEPEQQTPVQQGGVSETEARVDAQSHVIGSSSSSGAQPLDTHTFQTNPDTPEVRSVRRLRQDAESSGSPGPAGVAETEGRESQEAESSGSPGPAGGTEPEGRPRRDAMSVRQETSAADLEKMELFTEPPAEGSSRGARVAQAPTAPQRAPVYSPSPKPGDDHKLLEHKVWWQTGLSKTYNIAESSGKKKVKKQTVPISDYVDQSEEEKKITHRECEADAYIALWGDAKNPEELKNAFQFCCDGYEVLLENLGNVNEEKRKTLQAILFKSREKPTNPQFEQGLDKYQEKIAQARLAALDSVVENLKDSAKMLPRGVEGKKRVRFKTMEEEYAESIRENYDEIARLDVLGGEISKMGSGREAQKWWSTVLEVKQAVRGKIDAKLPTLEKEGTPAEKARVKDKIKEVMDQRRWGGGVGETSPYYELWQDQFDQKVLETLS